MNENSNEEDECELCTFWQRIGRYSLLRLKEPTTWAALTGFATVFGINIAPEKWQEISSLGVILASVFFAGTRGGRNKPDNPTLMSTITGKLPPQPTAIVPPTIEGMETIATPKSVAVDAEGDLHKIGK